MPSWDSWYVGKRVLVTGAGGFIGSHLAEGLAAAGAKVRAWVRYSSRADAGNLEHLPRAGKDGLEIIRGDIRDPHSCLRAAEKVDVVFHLAALIGIPYSYHAPGDYVAVNVAGTLNILEACRVYGMSRVIHTSTSEVYGTAQTRPISEQHPLVGQSPYSASKIGADKLAESYFRSFSLPVVTVRPSNTYGPRQSARAVIPTIFSQLLAGFDSVALGSLAAERDLTYVTDTVQGFLALGACGAAVGKTVNLGTGQAITIGDLAEKCQAIAGRRVPIVADSARVRPEHSEVLALICDNSQAKALTGWTPQGDLKSGLQAGMQFISQHPDLFRPAEYQR